MWVIDVDYSLKRLLSHEMDTENSKVTHKWCDKKILRMSFQVPRKKKYWHYFGVNFEKESLQR